MNMSAGLLRLSDFFNKSPILHPSDRCHISLMTFEMWGTSPNDRAWVISPTLLVPIPSYNFFYQAHHANRI